MTVGPLTRDEATAEFLDGTAAGQFLLRHCPACGATSAPQAAQCERCAATELGWKPAAGHATLISWTITHPKPGTGTAPLIAGIAQLTEGPWWWSQIADADPAQLHAGAPLRIEYRRHDPDSEAVPVFVLADAPVAPE